MIAVPSILSRLTTWHRAPAILGLVALALLHIAAATHQFEHQADHDLNVCEACAAYSQLEDAAIPSAPGGNIPAAPDAAGAPSVADLGDVSFAAAYWSRAPPLS